MPGSLYHHFESKEALLVELVLRYHADLDRIATEGMQRLDEREPTVGFAEIAELGSAIAVCAVTHRSALQMSFYESASPNSELAEVLARRPTAILEAMLQTLRAARWSGYLRPDVDLPHLADRTCQTMLQVGLDVMRGDADPVQVATLLCRILLEGIATGDLSDRRLDASPTFQAADTVVNSWGNDRDGLDDRQAHIRAVARAEFGRRGYEGTTIRDIAAAAGMGTGTVYRMIGSKDQLLASIMQEFGE